MSQIPLIGSIASGYGDSNPEIKYAETASGLKTAAKDFTSILFSQMFSAMRGNPDDQEDDQEHGVGGGLFSGDNLQMFIGFLDQEVGKKFSEQGAKDMVDALYAQLKGNNVFKDEKLMEQNKKASDLDTTKVNLLPTTNRLI